MRNITVHSLIKISDLFDLSHTAAASYLSGYIYPWEALRGISDFIYSLGEKLGGDYVCLADGVWAHKTAHIFPTAFIGGPAIIGEDSEVRHCAFIRGSALVGKGCVVGNSCELKNVILFDGVQVPHFNYVGDSILGYKAHMGAGSITSNIKSDKSEVVIKGEKEYKTGLVKVGAMLGDYVEIGCNSVLNPGTVIGRRTSVYPLSSVRGAIAADSIYKRDGEIVRRK